MESLNKFKILTIIFICMFVFVVAAIYANTKDVTEGKVKLKNSAENSQVQGDVNNEMANGTENSEVVNNLEMQIETLNRRVDELNEKLNNSGNASSTGLNCRIIGAMTDNGIEQLTEEAAVQEAKINNREMVITCSF